MHALLWQRLLQTGSDSRRAEQARPLHTMVIDDYVVDTLMADLIGHDKTPSAFVVYLYLYRRAAGRPRMLRASHQTIANDTGLSKSAVQRRR